LGLHDAARTVAGTLDRGNEANQKEWGVRIALAQLEAATGEVDRAIADLERIANDPAAKSEHREAMAALVTCYESAGSPEAALTVLQEWHAEVETARREVALEELRRIDGIDAAQDDDFELTTRSRIANYRVAINNIGARLSSKLHYLNELAVSAEIREGNEEDRAEHIYRVGALSSLLAAEVNCGEELCWLAEVAGRLHDIGKSSIPDAIALKARSLSEGEWEIVHGHSEYGARLVADADEPRLVQVVAAVRHHHEQFAGGGYPSNLSGEEIPFLARIVAISESFDAMLQSRAYRPSLSVRTALEEIERGAGSKFDPRLSGLFVQMVRRIQREVDDLKEYLGEHGRSSTTVRSFTKLTGLFGEHRRDDLTLGAARARSHGASSI